MKTPILVALVTLSIICSVTAKTTTPVIETETPIETKLTAPDPFENQQFGRSVAIDGNTAVMGAPHFAFQETNGIRVHLQTHRRIKMDLGSTDIPE